MRPRALVLALLLTQLGASTGPSSGPSSRLNWVGPDARVQTVSGTYGCGADPYCYQLTDADSDGNCAEDLQKGFNDLVALGGCPAAFTFYPPLPGTVCNFPTRVRMCYDSTPAVGVAVPDCTRDVGDSQQLPTITFRGPWRQDSKRMYCKMTAGGVAPEACLQIGNSYADGNFNNLTPVDFAAGSEPYIEQYTNDPNPLVPMDAPAPFICDGCIGTVGVRTALSNRNDIDGTSAGQFRFYTPPSFVGDNLAVRLYSEYSPTVLPLALGPLFSDYALFVGHDITVSGTNADISAALGLTGIFGGAYYIGTSTCGWGVGFPNTLTCSAEFGPDFQNTSVTTSTTQSTFSAVQFSNLTLSGRWDAFLDPTFKPLIDLGKNEAGYAVGNATLSGYFRAPKTSLNSTIKITNNSVSPGTITLSGTIDRLIADNRQSAVMGLIVIPPSTQPVPITVDPAFTYISGGVGKTVFAYGYPTGNAENKVDVTAPGQTTGTVNVPIQGAIAADLCINFTTGNAESCANAGTRISYGGDRILAFTQMAITSAVAGGDTCNLGVVVNGVAPTCPTCIPVADDTAGARHLYGSATLNDIGEISKYRHIDEINSGSYWQMKVYGSGTCELSGSFTLNWAVFPAI